MAKNFHGVSFEVSRFQNSVFASRVVRIAFGPNRGLKTAK